MKKIFALIITIIATLVLVGCDKGPVLYLLNWGEYINEDLLRDFEELYGVTVKMDKADSNEIMYTKIKSKSTQYDVVIPSDYMIHKLYKEDLLVELDYDLLPNYTEGLFDTNLEALRSGYFEGNQKYAVPYFWGTLGIMYNNQKFGIRDLVKEYEWEVFFNTELTGDARIGMYNSSRDAIAAAELYLKIDINTKDSDKLKEAEEALKGHDYVWGTDDLKAFIAGGNLDIALVYSGDFFDMLYATLEDESEVTYGMHVPTINNVWFDAMVIPTTSQNVTLAHNFINFMIDKDNAYDNATEIGYCPAIAEVYEMMKADPDYTDIVNNYPYYPGTVTEGTIYKDLGTSVYKEMEIILSNVKK